MSDETRKEVRARVYQSVLSIKGVGPMLATAISDKVMKYLDTVVHEESHSNEEVEDFPWDKIPAEYNWVAVCPEANDDYTEFVWEAFSREPTPAKSWWQTNEDFDSPLHIACYMGDACEDSLIPADDLPEHLRTARDWQNSLRKRPGT